MPLSQVTVERDPIHTRAIECRSYRRADGLWDIEGHLTDIKAYPFLNSFRGEVLPGEPLHDMWIRLTVDRDFIVQNVEAVTDAGPYALCPAILPETKGAENRRWLEPPGAGTSGRRTGLRASGRHAETDCDSRISHRPLVRFSAGNR
mgnify:CR=1 FL=1